MRTTLCFALLLAFAADARAQDAEAVGRGLDAFMEGEFATAFRLLEPQARAGDAVAQYVVGICYRSGYGVKTDFAQGFRYTQAAAKRRFPHAWYQLGLTYTNGRGVARDLKTGADWYEKAALAGVAGAMTNIGGAYALGRGRPLDLVQGAAWFWLADKAGDPQAAGNFSYCKGKLRAEDKPRVEAAIKALEKKIAEARAGGGDRIQLHLEVADAVKAAFVKGQKAYEAKDYAAAKNYFWPLAQTGHPDACFFAGRMNQRGYGMPVDTAAAVRWYSFAVRNKHRMSMLNLGYMYLNGEGVKKNPTLGVQLFEAAAWRGIWDAQVEAGVARIRGELGGHPSPEWAYVWWTLAARDGNREIAKKNLRVLLKKDLDAAGVERAKRLQADVEARMKSGKIPPPPKLPAPPG